MASKRQMAGPVSDINVTPMADVMLVLLIIFMVVTPMLQKGVSVDMHKADNPRKMPDADKEDAVVLAVTRDGKIYLGSDSVSIPDITPKVKDRISSKLDKTVYVKSDDRAKYGDVVEVIEAVRAAGVDSLGLLTEKVERLVEQGFLAEELGNLTLYKPVGCGVCNGGYKGRFAIVETLKMTEKVRRMIVDGAQAIDIKAAAVKEGMVTLRRAGIMNVMRGVSSLEEVLRVTMAD